ncbi:hypothetical protein ALC57_14139 [Trachymyrmex cornetzi]|uniref:Uncharacterized protein n=1 Tax=Trachymyrmex cornetzi TaxID=471704 RepID=A0A151IYT0_9HYME|nr:hypothetical protein ALC57_14139 [Trachymyrmex cornetzi]
MRPYGRLISHEGYPSHEGIPTYWFCRFKCDDFNVNNKSKLTENADLQALLDENSTCD